jgi:hypothetical protein
VNAKLPASLFRSTTRGISDRRYVRLAGLSSYASREDVIHFMERNGIDVSSLKSAREAHFPASARSHFRFPGSAADEAEPDADAEEASAVAADSPTLDVPNVPLLAQGQADVFLNHAVWVYDAGSGESATEAAAKLSGKICGLKLVRAAPVDSNLVEDLIGTKFLRSPRKQGQQVPALRRRMSVIAPLPHERDRSVLMMGLPPRALPRALWAFFGAYDVAAIRLLRKERVASVVFRSPDEALRAIRERSNLSLHDHGRLSLKMHA